MAELPPGAFLGFVMIDLTQVAGAISEAMERAELIRAVAAGEPACFVYLRQKSRQPK